MRKDDSMDIRLGINPIGWSNDDMPELGGDIPLEQCLREARSTGYVGVELGNKFPRDAALLRPILAAHDLDLVSGWYSTLLLERDVDAEMKASAAHRSLLRQMGCTILIAAECSGTVHPRRSVPLSRRPVIAEADWPGFARRLSDFAEAVAADGLTLAYHHHMGTVVQSGEEIDQLMSLTGGAVKLLLDTGHATWAGARPDDLARRWRERIAHVHAKDVRAAIAGTARREDWSFLESVVAGVFTVPGDGCVDFGEVLSKLPGYRGWIVVEAEQDPAKANPSIYAQMGNRHLKQLLGR